MRNEVLLRCQYVRALFAVQIHLGGCDEKPKSVAWHSPVPD